eukprot:5952018-Pleurochrysis_carterae.AAC.1
MACVRRRLRAAVTSQQPQHGAIAPGASVQGVLQQPASSSPAWHQHLSYPDRRKLRVLLDVDAG